MLRAIDPATPALIQSTAAAYGVPSNIALAVANQESGMNQAAVGSSGEIGVFQLKPSTAADLGVDPTDLVGNITGGVKYLAQLFGQFGDWATALMAYNGGQGNVQRGTVSPAAQNYALSVLAAAGGTPDAIDAATSSAGSFPSLPSLDLSTPSATPFLIGAAAVVLFAWALSRRNP